MWYLIVKLKINVYCINLKRQLLKSDGYKLIV